MMFEDEAGFRQARVAWRAVYMLALADGHGVLESLRAGPLPAATVAGRCGLSPRVTLALLQHLAACGLLRLEAGGYALGEGAGAVTAAYREMRHEFEQMPRFGSLLRTGEPLHATVGGVSRDDDADREHFLAGLHRRSGASVGEVVRLVAACAAAARPSERGPRVLDLGGGHGRFAAAIADGIPGAEATLFDQPAVVAIARRLSGHGFAAVGGDYHRDPLGGPYDVVLLSNVVTCEPDDRALALLRRVREVLVPGGSLIVRDRMLRDDGAGPLYAADFALALAAGTDHGTVRTASEVGGLLRAAGLGRVATHECAGEEYAYAIARA